MSVIPTSAFLRACHRLPVPYTPVWAMRQAGRYLPEYRRVRERMSLLQLCKRPDAAAEVTVQPVDRLGVDAAILFADILLVAEPLGVGLDYAKGEGPVIARPIRTRDDVARLPDVDPDDAVPFVYETARLARRALAGRVPLIGFAGAPFTVASYLIEGGPSRNFLLTKRLMYTDPDAWTALMERLTALTARYLRGQIAAGADAVQLFDSWVGCLAPEAYRRYVLPYSRAVFAALPPEAPAIHFGTGTGGLLEAMRDAGGHVIGLDWRVELGAAWTRLGPGVGVQGNLDPAVLLSTPAEIKRGVGGILDAAAGRPGHVFNLGHGVLPETPWENLRAMVEMVHEMSRR
ncbi:MAG TPA: uroporphyrinogen decarboxylase [bacterium]|nr:uroporphyrinogen decarboxylase [bacterium]